MIATVTNGALFQVLRRGDIRFLRLLFLRRGTVSPTILITPISLVSIVCGPGEWEIAGNIGIIINFTTIVAALALAVIQRPAASS